MPLNASIPTLTAGCPNRACETNHRPVDLVISVSFDTQSPDRSTIAVTAADPALVKDSPIIRESFLTLLIGRTWLELSAVQSDSDSETDQVSYGAVRRLPTIAGDRCQ